MKSLARLLISHVFISIFVTFFLLSGHIEHPFLIIFLIGGHRYGNKYGNRHSMG